MIRNFKYNETILLCIHEKSLFELTIGVILNFLRFLLITIRAKCV